MPFPPFVTLFIAISLLQTDLFAQFPVMAPEGKMRSHLQSTKCIITKAMPQEADALQRMFEDCSPTQSAFEALIATDGNRYAITLNPDDAFEQSESEYWDGTFHYVVDSRNRSLKIDRGLGEMTPFAHYITRTIAPGSKILSKVLQEYTQEQSLVPMTSENKSIFTAKRQDGFGITAVLIKLDDGTYALGSYLLQMADKNVYSAFINVYSAAPRTPEDIYTKLNTIYRLDLGADGNYLCLRMNFSLIKPSQEFDKDSFRPGPLGEVSVWDQRVTPSISYKAFDNELPLASATALSDSQLKAGRK